MITKLNEESKRTEWTLNAWYEKTVYVCGWIAMIFFLFGFIQGIIEG